MRKKMEIEGNIMKQTLKNKKIKRNDEHYCKVCKAVFLKKIDVIKHMSLMHPRCAYCRFRSCSIEDHEMHKIERHFDKIILSIGLHFGIKRHSSKCYECMICSRQFDKKGFVCVHISRSHPLMIALFSTNRNL